MSVERVSVDSLQALLQALEQRKDSKGGIFVLICGGVEPETGEGWCPDCVRAEPVISKVVDDMDSGVFIRCTVGDRATWKDSENVFRKHPQFKIRGIPTLMKWGSPKRIEPDECDDEEVVRMLIFDDDDDY